MAEMTTKSALDGLTDADLLRIVANPTVGREWAKLAKVNYAELKRGHLRAMRGVRIAIMKRHGRFAHSLAHAWEFLLDPEEAADLDGDVLLVQAELAGFSLGPTGGRAMLYALAEDTHLADAGAVRDRLEELLAAIERGAHFEPDDEAEDDDEESVEDTTSAEDLADEADEDGPNSAGAADLEDLQDRAAALLDEVADLVDQLRVVSAAIAEGRPAPHLGEGPDNWSDAAQAVLKDAAAAGLEQPATLPVVVEQLRTLSEQRLQQESERRSNACLALEMIDVLRKAGREEMIGGHLALHGFTSVEEVEKAAGVQPTPAAAAASELAEPEVEAEDTTLPDEPTDEEPPAEESDAEEDTPAEAVEEPAEAVAAEANPPSTTPPTQEHAVSDTVSAPASATALASAASSPSTSTAVIEALAVSATELDESGVSLGEWPWDEGDPPLVAQLLLDGREALAYYLATAAAEIEPRRQLLLFACAAAHCTPLAIELSLLPSDADIKAFDTNESLLLLAASLRAGMRLGYAPLGLQSLLDAADQALADSSVREVLHAAATAVQRGHGRRQPESGPSADEMAARWTALGADAAKQLEKLRDKTLKFQRGSKVLRYVARDGQPLADALSGAAALTAAGVASASSPDWKQIEDTADQLRDQNRRERLLLDAETAVSTPQQRARRPIDGPVKNQLDDLIADAGDLLARLLTVRRAILTAGDLKDIAVDDDLERALHQAPAAPTVSSVGDAAVANLIAWLRADDPEPTAQSVPEVLDAALLELFELPRDEQGQPLRAPTTREVALLLSPRDPDTVVAGYLAKGDIAAARDFIAAHGLEGAGYDDQIQRAIKRSKAAFEKARGDAEEGAARLRALYVDDMARELSERIEQIGDTPRNDRFDLAIEALHAIAAQAETALISKRDDLTARVDKLACDAASKKRVLSRIDARDEPLAINFLRLLENGQPLPEVDDGSGDDFSQFVPGVVDIAANAQAAGQDPLAAVRHALKSDGNPSVRTLRDGLLAWQNLKTRRRSGEDFKNRLGDVLRMVGLTPKAQGWYRGDVSRQSAGGYATVRVAASPVDRSYVPQFGSQAHGMYDVTLVWDVVSPSRLMDFISEANRTRPNIILYFGALSLTERRQLRALTRTSAGGKGFSPIVIDEAVVGWLSHLAEPGWRFTQRVTLPFTTLNPYQPNAAGEVPEEVFVGRSDERARIENPTGSMFVYGGRQLGKSALLRRVERLCTDLRPVGDGPTVAGKAAVYLDLKAAGIGEAQEPSALWPLLGDRLNKLGIVSVKAARGGAQEVTSKIMGWLEAEESNQLLLLLDEADNFLTADANSGDGQVGGEFPVLQALKLVMEESRRRFKAVFAGLHQVQRFFDASNTPVAHGGDAIPIGPLRTHDASDLVVSPMKALGYRFENPELVWRLLLVTNYQASLVQIVCEALVNYLQKRQIPEGGGRMSIGAEDVRNVCSDPAVRELIAQRFRWTINLDSRYRVIALVVALGSIGADAGVAFTVDELRQECEVWWPEGFRADELRRNEFERYLVEMQGLGILQKQGADLWALSSPNVIQMLGTPDRLEKELQDAHTHLERPLEYNPTMARRIMGDSESIAASRSPLTDHELTTLLKDTSVAQVVFGTPALGIGRVVEVIKRQADNENVAPIVVDSLQSPELKRAGAGGKRAHVIVDLTASKADGNLAHICREAAARKNVTATVVIGPEWLDNMLTLDGVEVHTLRRWSVTGLRAWYGSPFDSPLERARLHRVTSGWPKLIEEVMAAFSKGLAPQTALDRAAARLANRERATQILADSCIDPKIAKAWVQSIPFTTGPDGIEQLPVSVEDITEALGVDGKDLLARLQALDVADQDGEDWSLDRVILAAAATIYSGPE